MIQDLNTRWPPPKEHYYIFEYIDIKNANNALFENHRVFTENLTEQLKIYEKQNQQRLEKKEKQTNARKLRQLKKLQAELAEKGLI